MEGKDQFFLNTELQLTNIERMRVQEFRTGLPKIYHFGMWGFLS